MNLPEGVVGVVGAEEDEEERPAGAALWAGRPGGVGLDRGLTMAAAPSVDPMVLGPISGQQSIILRRPRFSRSHC